MRKIFLAQTLLHTVKQQKKMGMVEKMYTVDVLTAYRTYLPKIINVSLNLPKLFQKIYWPLFVDAMYFMSLPITPRRVDVLCATIASRTRKRK